MRDSTLEKYCNVYDEFLINGRNGTRAWLSFNPKSSEESAANEFSRILRIPDIVEYAALKQKELSETKKFTHESLVEDLIEIKDRCMQKVPVMVRKDGQMVQAQDEAGNNMWTFEASSAIKAVIELGKHDGKFYEKNNQDKSGSITPEQRAADIAAIEAIIKGK